MSNPAEPRMIAAEQIRAYAEAVYEVEDDGCWIEAAIWTHPNVSKWPRSIISACNPGSQPLSEAANQSRHTQLQSVIQQTEVCWWPARGRSLDFSWLEPSFLVEAPLTLVDSWARRYGQHAIWMLSGPQAKATIRIYAPHPVARLDLDLPHVQLEWVGFGPTHPQ